VNLLPFWRILRYAHHEFQKVFICLRVYRVHQLQTVSLIIKVAARFDREKSVIRFFQEMRIRCEQICYTLRFEWVS
jgi:hypothetical protein